MSKISKGSKNRLHLHKKTCIISFQKFVLKLSFGFFCHFFFRFHLLCIIILIVYHHHLICLHYDAFCVFLMYMQGLHLVFHYFCCLFFKIILVFPQDSIIIFILWFAKPTFFHLVFHQLESFFS
jgi:hypothetical protein